MNNQAKQDAIIARLDSHWSDISALQEHHRQYWGAYFQGLSSHDHLPNGIDKEPIDTETRPNDQATTYPDFWRGKYWELEGEGEEAQRVINYLYPTEAIEPVLNLATRVQFHTSNGPTGQDWSIVLDYQDTAKQHRYARAKDGTETPWYIVPPVELPHATLATHAQE